MTSGYSGTPLAKKLGIKDGHRACFLNQPAYYFELFSDLPKIKVLKSPGKDVDFIHLFCSFQKELITQYPKVKKALNKKGMLWVSWPKKSAGITSDLGRDWIREYILDHGLVDIKVCAVDEQWSGLKFVYRVTDR